jgi:hypothetical protein
MSHVDGVRMRKMAQIKLSISGGGETVNNLVFPSFFQTPMDCDYRPNDIVPIAVGVALALLVVTVLISYLVGRRRHRQRGYQSV